MPDQPFVCPKLFYRGDHAGCYLWGRLNRFISKSVELKAIIETLRDLHDFWFKWGANTDKLGEYAEKTKRLMRSAKSYDRWKAERFKIAEHMIDLEKKGQEFLKSLGECAQTMRAAGDAAPGAGVFYLNSTRREVSPDLTWEMGIVDPVEQKPYKKVSSWKKKNKDVDYANGAIGFALPSEANHAIAFVRNAPKAVYAHKYKRSLEGILAAADVYAEPANCSPIMCPCKQQHQHDRLFEDVLPCLIDEMTKRRRRKGIGSIPVIRYAETARSANAMLTGSKKVNREMAYMLTDHFLTHDCKLTQDIFSALWSEKEMEWMKYQDYATVYKLAYQSFDN